MHKTPAHIRTKSALNGLRTPGQILSLTSHLSFVNHSKINQDYSTVEQSSNFSVSTMSDGNITHRTSPNLSLATSPELKKVKTLSPEIGNVQDF